MDALLYEKYERVKSLMRGFDSVIVAFSGGVDSSLVAYIAAQELGTRALAVTSGSASLKRTDLTLSNELAERWGMRHRVIVTAEVDNPDYAKNPINRCFYCKTSLYDALDEIAKEEGIETVLNGTNLDDLGDHRPGLQAADEHGVRSPLVDAQFTKADIRALAHHLGLENANKPQAACLSSRFPYGTPIDRTKLAQVEAAEAVLERLGFEQYRVRHHGDVARLELLAEDIPKALAERALLEAEIKAAGYRFVALDLGGFRSGSLNDGIIKTVNL